MTIRNPVTTSGEVNFLIFFQLQELLLSQLLSMTRECRTNREEGADSTASQ